MRSTRNGFLSLIVLVALVTACSPSPSEQANRPPSRDDAGTGSDASTPGPEDDAGAACREGEEKSCECPDGLSGVSRCDAAGAWSSCVCASLRGVRGLVVSTRDATPIAGAAVGVRGQASGITTNDEGEFELDVAVGSALEVRAEGHVTRTHVVADSDEELHILVQPLAVEVVIDTQLGGSVTAGGARIVLPQGTQMRNARGDIVEGNVTLQVAMFESANSIELQALPSGEGINLAGEPVHVTLATAMEVSAFADGEQLNIAPGSHVDVELPAPSDGAPLESTLWHYDAEVGVWREEVAAARTLGVGDTPVYRARLLHFSYWATGVYCAAPEACVVGRVVQNGEPVAGVSISSARDAVWCDHYNQTSHWWYPFGRNSGACIGHADGGTTAADGTFRLTGSAERQFPHSFVSARGAQFRYLTYPKAGVACANAGDIELVANGARNCGYYGLYQCAGTEGCTSLLSDPRNCGTCGRACGDGLECSQYQCVCPTDSVECREVPSSGPSRVVCTDLQDDRDHCGACGQRCDDGQECILGKCEDASCPDGYTRCGASCIDLSADDPKHCGACGRTCGERESCLDGACKLNVVCGDGFVDAPEVCDDGLNAGQYGGCMPGCGALASRCGDGVLQTTAGELCDPGSTKPCPTTCQDDDACTIDTVQGTEAACDLRCVHQTKTQAEHGDGCCLSGRNAVQDDDCTPVCGNGVKEPGELCDDGTNQGAYGGCMPGCKALAARCGDGVLQTDSGELCENGSATPCPTACSDDQACTSDALVGSASSCSARCVFTEITTAAHGDSCCLPGSNTNVDNDCAPVCGNSILEPSEACDDGVNDGGYNGCAIGCATLGPRCGDGIVQTAAGESCDPNGATPCPASCDDDDSCTTDSSTGNAETCTLVCNHAPITEPAPGDLCCPDGANSLTDEDCPAICGNGVVELSEVCDDGINDNRYDGCATDCKALGPHCGDDIVQAGELCDGESCELHCDDQFACTKDRYAGSSLDCTGHCEFDPITEPEDGDLCCPDGANKTTDADCPAICGNAVLEPGEVCEDGNTADGDGCSWNCKSNETCGNKVIDSAKGEVCDDGNTAPNDGCNATCTSNESCGNGVIDTSKGEVCDDGNTTANDGCSATCTSTEQCGNGLTDPGEVCDDGDEESGDGCSADCKSDESCGNSVIDAALGEVCDDGGNFDGDGCSADCTSDESCGNQIIDVFAGEVCDDGNQVSDDGCSATCTSNESCGNGTLDGSEVCDDGDTESDDGCNASCTSDESCGNDYLDPFEACDDGNNTSGDGCNDSCTSDESCGNEILDPHEACEDGNTTSDDGCNATCSSDETCGNAYLDPEEACDDGDTVDGNGCNATCTSDETCGNAYLDPGEVCDDGNTEPGDNCSPDCASLGVCENGSCNGATLAAGGGHACMIRNGSVWCWGVNYYGQVGDGTTTYPLTAVQVPGLTNVVALSGGRDHTCALRDTGEVYCWGRGLNYRLGNFATADVYAPSLVYAQGDSGNQAALPNARAIAAGGSHSCMLTPEGGGYCWGSNAYGQLGVTDNSGIYVTEGRGGIAIARWGGTFANATRIATGLEHTCALHEDKTVSCWGRRNSGQVGDTGSSVARMLPNPVASLTDVVDIAAGDKHSCAVLTSGEVRCWGDNNSGQLGNTSVTYSYSPLPVFGITDAVAVTAHSSRTCVLHETGRVSCWGFGMAGDGVTTNATTPVYVADLYDAVEVATGGSRTCALRATGDVMCFGPSYLGNGTADSSATLVTVLFPE